MSLLVLINSPRRIVGDYQVPYEYMKINSSKNNLHFVAKANSIFSAAPVIT